MSEIPNVFFLYWSGRRFSIHHYICLKSITEVEKPDEIFLYYNDPVPDGNIWWERCKSLATFKELTPDEFPEFGDILGNSTYTQIGRWLTSDIFSALSLYYYGGIYIDFDTIVIKSLKDINCDAFIASCRNATAYYNPKTNKFSRLDNKAKAPWSYLCNGILGSKPKHPYYRQVLESFQNEEYDIYYGTGQLHYINAYETNKNNFPNLKILPWSVCGAISERQFNKKGTIQTGESSIKITDFFQGNCGANKDVKVFHYYSSKSSGLMRNLSTPYRIQHSNSTYSQYAMPYINEFISIGGISPDRFILEKKIIPHLSGNVCFVGVSSHVQHYWSKIFPKSVNVITIDNNPTVAKYGASNHFVVEAKYMENHIPHQSLNYVIMHWLGIRCKIDTIRFAFRGAFRCLKPGGLLIYGWANVGYHHSPGHLLRKSYETDVFEMVKFHDLPLETICNDYINPDVEYNVPTEEFRNMDMRFICYQKPKEMS